MSGVGVILIHVTWTTIMFALFSSYYLVPYDEIFKLWLTFELWIIIGIGIMTIGND